MSYLSSTKPYENAVKFRCVARATMYPGEVKEKVRKKYMANMPQAVFERYWKTRVAEAARNEADAVTRNFRYLFDSRVPPYAEGRFNTDAFPALYTAKSIETAKAERFHYATPGRPFPYVVYSIFANGDVVDLRPFQDARELELSNDHTNCRTIAKQVHGRCSGVAWYSVREEGSCCVFYTCDGITPRNIEEEDIHVAR